jgi:hypothetical protein
MTLDDLQTAPEALSPSGWSGSWIDWSEIPLSSSRSAAGYPGPRW